MNIEDAETLSIINGHAPYMDAKYGGYLRCSVCKYWLYDVVYNNASIAVTAPCGTKGHMTQAAWVFIKDASGNNQITSFPIDGRLLSISSDGY